ncbi:MAG: hypothetical protein ACRCX8_21160 [Sarcina sp.]
MVGLLVESTCNQIHTERNLELNSNIKRMVQVTINDQVLNLHKVFNVKENRFFREEDTDLLHTIPSTKNSIDVLEANGYNMTTVDYYNYTSFNNCCSTRKYSYAKLENPNFISSINLNFKGVEEEFSYFNDDNFIVFYDIETSGDKYFYHLDDIYKLKDFKVDSNMFVHILYEFEGDNYYVKSSLYLPFLSINEKSDHFNEDFFLEKIKILESVNSIYSRKNSLIYFYNKDYDIVRVKTCKRYYFELNGLIYFNHGPIYDIIKNNVIESFIQLNNLNMYSYISLLGLNEFNTKNDLKISSIDGTFNNLFKNRFNNTVNGGINYFNTRNIKTDVDYKVNIKDDFFAINGNFVSCSELKGKYRISIFKNKCSLHFINGEIEEHIKTITVNSRKFYLCNLEFNYLRFDDLKEPYVFYVCNNDPYPFTIKNDSNIIVNKIYNNIDISRKTLGNIKMEGFENHKIEAKFDGKNIIVTNTYDYGGKSYLFDTHTVIAKRNEKIDMKSFKDFKTNIPFVVKNGYLYPKKDGIIVFTTMSDFRLPLINTKDYITDYWIDNQGKEIYLKLYENKVGIIENKNEADLYFKVPVIDDLVMNETQYTIIAIEDNSDYESEWDANKNSLITDRFMNVPLFSVWYVENTDYVELYTVDKKPVTNVITEHYNGGLIVYFDSLDDTLYYNTKETKYNYFTPLRSYENITNSYSFDDNLEIDFGSARVIDNFTLSCDRNISSLETINLLMYNNESGETFKLSLNAGEIGKPFALGISIDSITIEKTQAINDAKFTFKITKVNSITQNGKVTYMKGHIDNPVYQAIIKPKDIKFNSYKNIKVDTKYEFVTDGTMKESYRGDLVIRRPFENEIIVTKKNNFKYYYKKDSYCLATEKDDFFLSNFKTPGLITKTVGDLNVLELTNGEFTVDEIIDKNLLGGN